MTARLMTGTERQKALRAVRALWALAVLAAGLLYPFAPAQACCTCLSVTQPVSYREWFTTGKTVDDITQTYRDSMTMHEAWIVSYMFRGNILPAMQMMAQQLSAVMLQQAQILGAFFDAKQQLETQRTFQRLQAEAHRDYHTSTGLCELGSAVKSLASSERRGEYNVVALSQRSLDRALGTGSTAARQGQEFDIASRLAQYRSTYCDPKDNNGLVADMCESTAPPERRNRDIDYASLIDYPLTLNVNFTDNTLKYDEQDVFALAAHLYGETVFARPPSELLQKKVAKGRLQQIMETYMDARAVIAKRGVAENSFNALVGMKSEGPDSTVGSKEYLRKMIEQLGVADDKEIEKILGKNPSYYAQMEVLTKRIFENPQFYTNLYDKPANVARKDVALKAISLMQKFDTFKSSLRTEANLSMLLEISNIENETRIRNMFGDTIGKGMNAPAAGGGTSP